ncbi:phosphate propanoyltransferase [Neobacillus sp. FSL H8-0543]|uniref:phosphate propanoyltransferase n=1 Tax=Neobacillus sp. FSL H8-0543 TaxID=2954672 RepID=UPI0031582793
MSKQKLPKEFPLQEGDKLTPSAKDFLLDRKIPIVADKAVVSNSVQLTIPVGVSNRHAHLSEYHFHLLFGDRASLTVLRSLSQPGQFAAYETVTIVGQKGVLQNVRILGPLRNHTQIEISKTDGFTLGVHPPIRPSGLIEGTPGITIVGPVGSVTIDTGLIIAKNHVHLSKADAKIFDVINGDSLIVKSNKRPVIFHDVTVRVQEEYQLEFHIDMDEANASGVNTGDTVRVIGKNRSLFSTILGDEQDG